AALCGEAAAKVSPQEADRLGKELTPVGAEKAGNKDSSIPAWDGGLNKSPACYKGAPNRYCDAFPDDMPLYTITKANLDQYKDKLSPGQLATFAIYGDTYKLNVYPTRRTYANPDYVYEATKKNALNSELISNGEGIAGAILGVPFPIPKSGQEVVWNHKLTYLGPGFTHWNEQAAVTASGEFNLVKLREDIKFPYGTQGMKPEDLNNVGIYFLQIVTEPPRLAGTITLVHETMDQVKEPRRAWQYNPGQRRLRRAPNVGYDNPGTGSDGLRTNDQYNMFNGATDRYTWKLVGKREMIVPYNSYVVHSDKYKVKDIVRKGHVNQDLLRYELHRVWVVEAALKPGMSHLYARRLFYVDEDSWHMLLADNYDGRGQLWRWQESHAFQAYDRKVFVTAMDVMYDLQSRRYIAMQMSNEDDEGVEKQFPAEYFDPANVQKQATK
ncbi:MAG TPA: DUF1329 domain-containing protein, partial [Nevskiaceae bacterium]|nr:DUF1329 domain-containing protein [Nevskiaceae bacterium]